MILHDLVLNLYIFLIIYNTHYHNHYNSFLNSILITQFLLNSKITAIYYFNNNTFTYMIQYKHKYVLN